MAKKAVKATSKTVKKIKAVTKAVKAVFGSLEPDLEPVEPSEDGAPLTIEEAEAPVSEARLAMAAMSHTGGAVRETAFRTQ